jgi:hypothetical protein
MPQPHGKTLPLSLPRRFVCDLLHFAQKVPTVSVERRMALAEVAAARAVASPRPGWCSLFTKAYGFVSAAWPELRRTYLSFPRPHLYEHPVPIATVAVEREYRDEKGVFFCHVVEPQRRGLADLDAELHRAKEAPLESVGSFRRALLLSSLPRPLRRLVWWYGLNASGRQRARVMGTFAVSVFTSLGAVTLHALSPLTTTLHYGIIDAAGAVDVRLTFDHRVLDGAVVARVLEDLERALKGPVLNELGYLRPAGAA